MADAFEYKDLDTLRHVIPPTRRWPEPNMALYFFQSVLTAHGVPRDGVIHLGAHAGQEVVLYTAVGFQRALMVEPLPDEFEAMRSRCSKVAAYAEAQHNLIGADDPRPIAFQSIRCAVADKAGVATFYETALTENSSLMKPIHAATDDQFEAVQIEVEVRTLDHIVQNLDDGWTAKDFSYLRMNIQGTELMALQGAGEVLKHLKAIMLEVNLSGRYEAQPSKEDFDRFLGARGFECTLGILGRGSKSYGNLLYCRR